MEEMDVRRLEKMRKGVKRRRWLCMALSLASFAGFLKLFYPYAAMEAADMPAPGVMAWVINLIAAAVAGCVMLAVFWKLVAERASERFRHAFKCKYVLQTIEGLPGFRELLYSPKGGFSYDDIRNAAVVGCGDQKYFESEDLLTGLYQDVRFRFSDVTSRRLVRKSRGRGDLVEIFNGQVIQFDRFDDRKASRGHLQIFQKEFLSDLRGWTAEHPIQTENEPFNRKFQIYAADEHNAFYVLTPVMMEKITAFSDAAGKQVAVSFRGSSMFVAIAGRGSMFEPADDIPVPEQGPGILEDIGILQMAGDILLAVQAAER